VLAVVEAEGIGAEGDVVALEDEALADARQEGRGAIPPEVVGDGGHGRDEGQELDEEQDRGEGDADQDPVEDRPRPPCLAHSRINLPDRRRVRQG
jgi:hypothetical protein